MIKENIKDKIIFEKESALKAYLSKKFLQINVSLDVDFVVDLMKVDLNNDFLEDVSSNMPISTKIFFDKILKDNIVEDFLSALRETKVSNTSGQNYNAENPYESQKDKMEVDDDMSFTLLKPEYQEEKR